MKSFIIDPGMPFSIDVKLERRVGRIRAVERNSFLLSYAPKEDNWSAHARKPDRTGVNAGKVLERTSQPPHATARWPWSNHWHSNHRSKSLPIVKERSIIIPRVLQQELTFTSMKSGSPNSTNLAYCSISSVLYPLTKVNR